MTFAPILNSYCVLLNCSNKEIAERCGVSMSALSHYRSGKRVPRSSSEVIDHLAEGISSLASERGISAAPSKAAVKRALTEGLVRSKPLGPSFAMRVDSLMKLLGIKNIDVAIPLHLDSSYISRIRRGERTPNDKRRFAEVVAQVAALNCMERGLLKEVLALMDADEALFAMGPLDIDSALSLAEHIGRWLLGNQIVESDILALEEYFDQLNRREYKDIVDRAQRSEPAQCPQANDEPRARIYTGKDQLWNAELDFLRHATACGAQNLYLSSDMPALETRLSPEQADQYREALLELISRGCHITVAHDPNRSLSDSIKALQAWTPLYMTRQVTPLFMDGTMNRLFCHANNVCECCALVGEAIRGHEEDGRFYLSSRPDDLKHYQKKMNLLLESSYELYYVYYSDDAEGMQKFEKEEAARQASGRGREVRPGLYENLRIVSYHGDCFVLYIGNPVEYCIVVRHPKLRYIVAHMS